MLAALPLRSIASIAGGQNAPQRSHPAQEFASAIEGDGSLVVPMVGAGISVTVDGTPVALVDSPERTQWAEHELGLALGNADLLVSDRAPLLVDGNGIAWTAHGGRLVGYRGERAVHEYPNELDVKRGNAAEVVYGRVWFTAGQE